MLCSFYFGHTARFLPGRAVVKLSVSMMCCGRALGLGEPDAEHNRLRLVCQLLVAMLFRVAVSHVFQGQEAVKGSLARLPPPPHPPKHFNQKSSTNVPTCPHNCPYASLIYFGFHPSTCDSRRTTTRRNHGQTAAFPQSKNTKYDLSGELYALTGNSQASISAAFTF